MKNIFDDKTSEPCPRCLDLADQGKIDIEAVMPLPQHPPMSIYGVGICCHDCQSADNLVKLKIMPEFDMARVSVANDRLEHLRLPKGIEMGLVESRLMMPCHIGNLEDHQAWLESIS